MKYFISIVIVAILVWAGIAWNRSVHKSTTSSTNQTVSSESGLTVHYTGSEFSPSTLTIKANQTVTFINDSSDLVQVASNPHPVHTDLAGFDSLKGFGEGETYSFTFTKVGSFGYHNHLNPAQTGTIIVEP